MTVLLVVLVLGSIVAAGALTMTLVNLGVYRRSRRDAPAAEPIERISVCIPARNEEENIEGVVRSLLENDWPDLEVVVYDDESTDRTPEILERLHREDGRVRVAPRVALPEGWVGKQHACQQCANHATGAWLLFTDADVRFERDALRRTIDATRSLNADMTSTFPREVTGTLAEALIVPMIHFILLSYLPMPRMRTTKDPSASAGCGQFLFVRREAYKQVGGHGAWRESMHDGIRMPRALRKAGFRTDLFDGTDLCSCRMYRGWGQTWRGFAKNAFEGLGSVPLLCIITVLHLIGHVLPWIVFVLWAVGLVPAWLAAPAILAMIFNLAQRLILAHRFEQSIVSAVLHPVGVVLMTLIQWHSLWLHVSGKRSWRGREAAHPA